MNEEAGEALDNKTNKGGGLMKLGKLKEITDIRKVWSHEQYDFSQWLADADSIQELGEVVGLSLTNVETEKFVGSFRCDILCKDEITGKTVLIENQLEPTNHDHLGKLITYASGLDASIVIWIVSKAREEHVSAIRWMNEHTDDTVSFFLLEIHAFVIEDSLPAPKFVIIEKPNDFVRSVKSLNADSGEGGIKAYQHQFWNQFVEVLEQRGSPFRKHQPPKEQYYQVPLGSSHYRIDIGLQKKKKCVDVCLWLLDDKELFNKLQEHRESIEKAIQYEVKWERLDNAKASAVYAVIPGLNFDDQSNYPELMNKVIDVVLTMKEVCLPILKDEV